MLPTHRSMIEFIRGACGEVSTIRTPSARKTSSNRLVNLRSRSLIKTEVSGSLTHVEHQVAGLLGDPDGGRVRSDAQNVDAAGGVLDHGEAVQPGERDRLYMEEVGGQDPFRLSLQELSPGRLAATGCRIESGLLLDRPHGGRGGLPAQSGDLPGYTPISPGRILSGQTQNQGTDRGPDRWSARPALGVGPASLHQVGVPAQERPRCDEQMVSADPG
jgi:hypothetical protein